MVQSSYISISGRFSTRLTSNKSDAESSEIIGRCLVDVRSGYGDLETSFIFMPWMVGSLLQCKEKKLGEGKVYSKDMESRFGVLAARACLSAYSLLTCHDFVSVRT